MDWATNRNGSSEGTPLLTTKLHVARTQPNLVHRARLLDRLDDGLRRRLTLVVAPAGYGKTTLLADWARRDHRVVAWLTLDAGDNEPRRFWHYLVGALQQVQPGLGHITASALDRGETFAAALTPLINELAGISGTIGIVLDDFHTVTHPEIRSTLNFFIERMPTQVHLYLSSRQIPGLQLARLRARGELSELHRESLAFTDSEAEAVVRGTAGAEATPAEVDEVVELAEGWGVGLQLAALSMLERSGPAADATSRYRYVAEYLQGEILEHLAEPTREMLLRLALLDRFNGDLAISFAGSSAAEQLLSDLVRDDFYVLALDDEPGWYRMHRLFRLLLSDMLERHSPDIVIGLRRRAAEWFEDHGISRDAVRHMVALGDMDSAVRLAERCAEELLAQRRLEPLLDWQRMLPSRMVSPRPRLALAFAWALLLSGETDRARNFAAMARTSAPKPPRDGLADVTGHLEVLENALSRMAAPAVSTELDETALPARNTGLTSPGNIDRPADALGLSAGAHEVPGPFSSHYGVRFGVAEALPEIARVELQQGLLNAAASTFDEALEMLVDERGDEPAVARTAATCHIGRAEIEYERNNLDAAMRHVTAGLAYARTTGDAGPVGEGFLLLTRIHEARGDRDGAFDAVAEADHLMRKLGASESERSIVDGARAHLALAHGEVADAAVWSRSNGTRGSDGRMALLNAHICLAQRRSDEAAEIAAMILRSAEASGARDLVIRALLVQGLALEQVGESEHASQCVQRALLMAESGGYLRTILDEGEPMARLLKKMRAMQETGELGGPSASREYVRVLLTGLGVHPRPTHANGPGFDATISGGLLTPISDREIEVLRLIADGKSNAAIADALYVSVSTVKTHINNLYSKLGVESRTQALARAREHSLI